MTANTIASKTVSETASALTAASAQSITTALTTVARGSDGESCQSSARWKSRRTANDSTAPLVAHSCATGSTESGNNPIPSRLAPSPMTACGMSRVASRTRRVAGTSSRSRARSAHEEPAMIAPLKTSPPLKARLEKSPLMPRRLK